MKPLLEVALDIAEAKGIGILRAVLILADSFRISHRKEEFDACIAQRQQNIYL